MGDMALHPGFLAAGTAATSFEDGAIKSCDIFFPAHTVSLEEDVQRHFDFITPLYTSNVGLPPSEYKFLLRSSERNGKWRRVVEEVGAATKMFVGTLLMDLTPGRDEEVEALLLKQRPVEEAALVLGRLADLDELAAEEGESIDAQSRLAFMLFLAATPWKASPHLACTPSGQIHAEWSDESGRSLAIQFRSPDRATYQYLALDPITHTAEARISGSGAIQVIRDAVLADPIRSLL